MSVDTSRAVLDKGPRQRTFLTAFFLTVAPSALAYLCIEYTATILGQGFITDLYQEHPFYFALWVLVVIVLVLLYGLMLSACRERMIKKFSPEQVEAANSLWHIAIVAGIVALGAAERAQVVTEIDLHEADGILQTRHAFTTHGTGEGEQPDSSQP